MESRLLLGDRLRDCSALPGSSGPDSLVNTDGRSSRLMSLSGCHVLRSRGVRAVELCEHKQASITRVPPADLQFVPVRPSHFSAGPPLQWTPRTSSGSTRRTAATSGVQAGAKLPDPSGPRNAQLPPNRVRGLTSQTASGGVTAADASTRHTGCRQGLKRVSPRSKGSRDVAGTGADSDPDYGAGKRRSARRVRQLSYADFERDVEVDEAELEASAAPPPAPSRQSRRQAAAPALTAAADIDAEDLGGGGEDLSAAATALLRQAGLLPSPPAPAREPPPPQPSTSQPDQGSEPLSALVHGATGSGAPADDALAQCPASDVEEGGPAGPAWPGGQPSTSAPAPDSLGQGGQGNENVTEQQAVGKSKKGKPRFPSEVQVRSRECRFQARCRS
jgi:hypothetical protein